MKMEKAKGKKTNAIVMDKNKNKKSKKGSPSHARKAQSSWASRKRSRRAGLKQPSCLGLTFKKIYYEEDDRSPVPYCFEKK
jgi:hypothetical protein